MKAYLKDFVTHFFRRLTHVIISVLFIIGSMLIYFATFEPGTNGVVTERKTRRIRALTKFKLYLWKYLSPLFKFAHYKYLEEFYDNYHFLIED